MKIRLPISTIAGTFLLGCGSHSIGETGFHTGFECFTRGTKVSTPEGLRLIETLQVGDCIWSWNTETGEPVARRIKECIVGESKEILRIQAGEQIIEGVTAEHPFWIPTISSWLKAGSLAAGQEVLAWLGHHEAISTPITAVHTKTLDVPVPVFTLSVEGPEHNFFAEGLLVHNKSPMPDCWHVEQSATSVDFGSVPVNTTVEQTYILKIFNRDDCSWLDISERTLSLTLDDPNGVFTMATAPIDLMELQGEELQVPITFTPNTKGSFEAQVLFNDTEISMAIRVPPKTIQIFGKGESSEP